MENEKKGNVAKSIFRVIGIVFSIVLIPGLILGIPAGGAVLGISSIVSQESLVRMVDEADLAELLLDAVEEEVAKEIRSDEVKAEYIQTLMTDCITVEWVDSVISEVLDAMYFGRTPNVTLDSVTKTLTDRLEELVTNGFGDIYSAWRNGTPSVYFTDAFVQSFRENLEEEILTEYNQLGASSLDDLETKYDTVYGAGAFSKLVDEKAQSFEKTWDEEFSAELDEMIDEVTETAEQEVNEVLAEVTQDPDIRRAFDYFKEIEAKASILKVIVYGVIFGAVLLLVSCFWFGTAGFIVSAVPLALGGMLCKVVGGAKILLLDYIDKVIMNETDLSEFSEVVRNVVDSVLAPLLDEVSKLGNITLIAAVMLIGVAIMGGVIRKNRTVKNVGNVEE